jgi:hypothetical protein
MRATTESDEFVAWVNDVVVPRIGPYPAGKIKWERKTELGDASQTSRGNSLTLNLIPIGSHSIKHYLDVLI